RDDQGADSGRGPMLTAGTGCKPPNRTGRAMASAAQLASRRNLRTFSNPMTNPNRKYRYEKYSADTKMPATAKAMNDPISICETAISLFATQGPYRRPGRIAANVTMATTKSDTNTINPGMPSSAAVSRKELWATDHLKPRPCAESERARSDSPSAMGNDLTPTPNTGWCST